MDDRSLRQNIIEELAWRPCIDSASIGVAVAQRDGQVETWADRQSLQEAAWSAAGVHAVVDQMQVG